METLENLIEAGRIKLDSSPAEALGFFENARIVSGSNPYAQYGIVMCYKNLRDAGRAEAEFSKLESLSPKLATELRSKLALTVSPYCDIAGQCLYEENLADAEAYFRIVLLICPDFPDALVGMGRVMLGRNLLTDSEEYFNKALKGEVDDYYALIGLADLRMKQGRSDKATYESMQE